jgi:hypothetical protein
MNKSIVSATIFACVAKSCFAIDKNDLEQARLKYTETAIKNEETARLAYTNRLAEILSELVDRHAVTGKYEHREYWDSVFKELKSHPFPDSCNSKYLSKAIIGEWQSPRRTYNYRANGVVISDASEGKWRIEKNILTSKDETYTLLVLNDDYLIFTAGDAVFYHSRVKK